MTRILDPRGNLSQISSDAFKAWSRCKKQFYYKHILGHRWPTDIQHFKLGQDVHKLLDYQARGLDCTLLLADCADNVRQSWNKLIQHPIVHLPIVANEWAFHVPISLSAQRTEWLTGRIDRIARDQEHPHKVLLIDWKTGTGIPKNPESDWQTILYRYALVETAQSPSAAHLNLGTPDRPLLPEDVEFVYIEVKADTTTPIRDIRIPYSQSAHQQAGELIAKTLTQMAQEQHFLLPETCPDRHCAFRPVCGIASTH